MNKVCLVMEVFEASVAIAVNEASIIVFSVKRLPSHTIVTLRLRRQIWVQADEKVLTSSLEGEVNVLSALSIRFRKRLQMETHQAACHLQERPRLAMQQSTTLQDICKTSKWSDLAVMVHS